MRLNLVIIDISLLTWDPFKVIDDCIGCNLINTNNAMHVMNDDDDGVTFIPFIICEIKLLHNTTY